MNITIEDAKIQDIQTMLAWGTHERAFLVRENGHWYSKDTLVSWIQDLRDDIALIARDGEIPIGMCLTHVLRDWAYCAALYVDVAYRKQGIGLLLLDETQKRLKGKGIHSLAFLVQDGSDELISYYAKRGFKSGFKFVWMDKKF